MPQIKERAGRVQSHRIEAMARGTPPLEAVKLTAKDAVGVVGGHVDLPALDGLRAAACLTCMAYHCLMLWGALQDLDTGYKGLDRSPFLRLIAATPIGVDVFLVLTGMWAAMHLVPALERAAAGAPGSSGTGIWPAIKNYYRKRVVRVLPAYLTAVLLIAVGINHSKDADPALRPTRDVLFEYCPATVPLNFVFISNLAGFAACGVHFWSLAVQMHFYLLFPLALWALQPSRPGFRSRVVRAATATLLLTSALRWVAAHQADVRMPLPLYAHPDMGTNSAELAVRFFHTLYFPTPARNTDMATGVLVGMLLLNGKAVAGLRRHLWALSAASAAVVGVHWRLVVLAKTYGTIADQVLWPHAKAYAALAYHGSPLYCAVVAALVLCLGLHANPAATAAARALASRPVRHYAKLSYDIYLLHMVALYWWQAAALPRGALAAVVAQNQVVGYLAIFAGLCVTSYLVGAAHHYAHAAAERAWRGARKAAAPA